MDIQKNNWRKNGNNTDNAASSGVIRAFPGHQRQISFSEIVTFEQQRFTGEFGEGVRAAIAHIELGGMTTAFSEAEPIH